MVEADLISITWTGDKCIRLNCRSEKLVFRRAFTQNDFLKCPWPSILIGLSAISSIAIDQARRGSGC